MLVTIGDTIRVMEKFAPFYLSEEWDNVGLQVGQRDWPVRTIWVALDPTLDVVTAACHQKVDLLITHHPLIFKPLKCVDFNTGVGSVIKMAISHRLAVYTAHTNLDSAAGGANEVLAKRIGLRNLTVLGDSKEPKTCKLVFYAPAEYEQQLLRTLFEAKALKIRRYPCRSTGKDIGNESGLELLANPILQKSCRIDFADEIRIESVVLRKDLKHIVEYVRKDHLRVSLTVEVYPLLSSEYKEGLGRVGELDEATRLEALALTIKKELGLKWVKVAGKPDLPINKAAVCTGSGSGLLNQFILSEAQVYISGDLRYHDARSVEAASLGLIDIGHFASEHLIVETLVKRLQRVFSKQGIDVMVEACEFENDPFTVI
jgi:dinuclear metal center YbgI/SA1388 family protein